MFLRPGTPGRQQVGLLQTHFSLQLCQLLPRLPLLQVEGPKAWPGHTCPCEKSGDGSKRQSPSPLVRRGRVSLHQFLRQPSCLGPQRSRREKRSLLSWGKLSDQWLHATQVVHTSAHKPNYNPLLLAGLSPEWLKWSNLICFPRAVRIQSQPASPLWIHSSTRWKGQKEVSLKQKGMRAGDEVCR